MSRNQSRVFGNIPETQQPPPPLPPQAQAQEQEISTPFDFIVPTELIDLPSKGEFYPEGHVLHKAETIEIKHMTAKEEDILTSSTLLKKGVAIDKMLRSIIINKNINIDDLLLGDKNALLVKSRIFGYGAEYATSIECPQCNTKFDYSFDLEELESKGVEAVQSVERTEQNTFVMILPKSNITVEYRLLTSRDERELSKKKTGGSLDLLKKIVVSMNDQTDKFYIDRALQSLPILDTSLLKKAYIKTMPDIDMNVEVECSNCAEVSEMGVPLDANFFWPNL